MNKCPKCGTTMKEYDCAHAPDGRCDGCAEEFGCECGCFPIVPIRSALEALDPGTICIDGGFALTVPAAVARGLPENPTLNQIIFSWALYDPGDPRLIESARRITAAFREDL